MEVMNYGVGDNGDHYWSGMTENASEGYWSESNTSSQPDGTPSTCFMLVSSSLLMHEVVKMVVIQVEY